MFELCKPLRHPSIEDEAWPGYACGTMNTTRTRTQVAIIGAGPVGLLLGQ